MWDSGVGKTTLLHRMTSSTAPTNGTRKDYLSRIAIVGDAAPVKVQLWDTAGQEKFGTAQLPSSFFRHADAALVVYDVTDRNSFMGVLQWVLQLQSHRNTATEASAFSLILVGHKSEVSDKVRQVGEEEGRAVAKLIAASHFFECSSRDGTNIQTCFDTVATTLIHASCKDLGQANTVAKTTDLFTRLPPNNNVSSHNNIAPEIL
ncbi:GTP-binding protein YPT6 [Phytophthora citrophthora]|uniref:GTP-binding protein YPT6 n=1 Tax=Phytophthora citrophthora TaxID=4793 RepID=A0AAD9G3T3_9STRA|nr:GTP-binding protein YPT6 [Phytophthora citrophthora]